MIVPFEQPFAQDLLRADPNRLDAAAEETLRWSTPVMVRAPVPRSPAYRSAGEKVVVSFASANRDEVVFADPMNLTRSHSRAHT